MKAKDVKEETKEQSRIKWWAQFRDNYRQFLGAETRKKEPTTGHTGGQRNGEQIKPTAQPPRGRKVILRLLHGRRKLRGKKSFQLKKGAPGPRAGQDEDFGGAFVHSNTEVRGPTLLTPAKKLQPEGGRSRTGR